MIIHSRHAHVLDELLREDLLNEGSVTGMSDGTTGNRETIGPIRTINSSELDTSSQPSNSRRQHLLRNSDT